MSNNLPPGITENMIPGNTTEDVSWEELHESIDEDMVKQGINHTEASVAWRIGLEAYKQTQGLQELSRWAEMFAQSLRNAHREGRIIDVLEGARYITISDIQAETWAKELEVVARTLDGLNV